MCNIPKNANRAVLIKKLLYMTHLSLVNIRKLALSNNTEVITDVSDAFEVFPSYINAWEDSILPIIRAEMIAMKLKHKDKVFDYMAILDMSDEEFLKTHSRW